MGQRSECWLFAAVLAFASVSPLPAQAPPAAGKAGEPTAKELDKLWDDLDSSDARAAYGAFVGLIAAPKQAVPLLEKHLLGGAAPTADEKRVARLIAELDADEFAAREKATDELEKMGQAVVPALRKALLGGPSLEVRRRIDRLLEKLAPPPAPALVESRGSRAVRVLEQVGTADARQLLEKLVKESPELSKEAKGALERLSKRSPAKR